MLWSILSFITALSESTKDTISKFGLRNINEYVLAWALRIVSSIILIFPLFFVTIPTIDTVFIYSVIIDALFLTVTSVIYLKAIKISPLSVAIPMLTFTPLFLLITSPLIVGEMPGTKGIFGIFLIVLGAYLLNLTEKSKGLLSPFKALVKEKGPVLMLVVAIIWSITANIDKIAVEHSNPFFYAFVNNAVVSLFLTPIVFIKAKKDVNNFPKNLKYIIPIGFLGALTYVTQYLAIMLTIVPYVISIKRLSAIFSAIYGFILFKEGHVKERLLGVIIMIIGVLFITLF